MSNRPTNNNITKEVRDIKLNIEIAKRIKIFIKEKSNKMKWSLRFLQPRC
jgi:hypothetical protein